MRETSIAFTLWAATAVAFAQASVEDDAARDPDMVVTLTGEKEATREGDSDGRGTLKLLFNPQEKKICYELNVRDIATPTSAYIHAGERGEAGAAKVILGVPGEGTAKGCVQTDAELIRDIMRNPTAYYVNVHNEEFPEGAIRGQLGR